MAKLHGQECAARLRLARAHLTHATIDIALIGRTIPDWWRFSTKELFGIVFVVVDLSHEGVDRVKRPKFC